MFIAAAVVLDYAAVIVGNRSENFLVSSLLSLALSVYAVCVYANTRRNYRPQFSDVSGTKCVAILSSLDASVVTRCIGSSISVYSTEANVAT